MKVTNGAVLDSEGKCTLVNVHVYYTTFVIEFFNLLLGDCDIVL